jgi:hypothetical protein
MLTVMTGQSRLFTTSRFVEPAPHAYINHHPLLLSSLNSALEQGTLLPQLLSAIPIASAVRTALARAGLRDLCSLKVLHGTRAIRFLGSVLMRLLAPWMTISSTSWRDRSWERLLRLLLDVTVRGTALRTSSCIDIVRLFRARPVE